MIYCKTFRTPLIIERSSALIYVTQRRTIKHKECKEDIISIIKPAFHLDDRRQRNQRWGSSSTANRRDGNHSDFSQKNSTMPRKNTPATTENCYQYILYTLLAVHHFRRIFEGLHVHQPQAACQRTEGNK